MDIYLKNGKKDFLLDDIVLLYSIYSVRVLFKTERLEMEEGQDFRGSAIGTVILSVKGGGSLWIVGIQSPTVSTIIPPTCRS